MIGYFAPLDGPGGLLSWLFGAGIGTNLGATLLVIGLGVWKLRRMWKLHMAHQRHQSMMLEELHHLAHHGTPHPRVVERGFTTPKL